MQMPRAVRPLVFSLVVALSLTACTGSPANGPLGSTAEQPAFAGISATSSDHSVAVRDLLIPDPGPAGYPAGTSVALIMQVWNNTNAPVSLTGASVTGGGVATLIDAKSTATAPGATFDLPISAGTNVPLNQTSGRFLQVRCANRTLLTGTDIPMTFAFSNGATIAVNVPIGRIPDSAAPTPAAC